MKSRFDDADQLAGHYMDLYRGTFCSTFLLGGFTVLFAAIAYLLKADREPLGKLFGVLEVGCVLAILVLFAVSRWRKWRIRAIDYRLLAELLRHTRWLSLVGSAVPKPRPPVHRQGSAEPLGWSQWYFFALVRAVGCGSCPTERSAIQMDSDYLRDARVEIRDRWVGDQCAFHAKTFRRYERLEKWLFLLGMLAFSAVLVACLVSLLIPCVHWSLLITVTAFPAFAAGFHGISSQAELKRLGEAYRRMQRELRESKARIAALPHDLTLDDLHPLAYEAGTVMLNELDDWHVAHRVHAVPLL